MFSLRLYPSHAAVCADYWTLYPPPAGIFGAGPDQWASCGRQPLFQIGSFFGGGGFLFDKFKMDVWSRLVFMLTAVKAGSGGVITRDQCNVRSE